MSRWDGFVKDNRTERERSLAEIDAAEKAAMALVRQIAVIAGSNPDTLQAAIGTLGKIATIGSAKANELGRTRMVQSALRKHLGKGGRR